MRAYLALVPPPGSARPALLLAERFSPAAFLLGPLWLFWHRAWVWGVVALVVALIGPWPATLAVHLLCGMMGRDAQAAGLIRRGWRMEALVMADDEEVALRRLLVARPALAPLFRA
ncbi:MAG: hypothetical protein N2588_02025 [Rhodovarius sp.]|nr:hypothetical protein [Rhodovarius sp.]